MTTVDAGDVAIEVVAGDLTLGETATAGDDVHLRAGRDILQPLDTVYVAGDVVLLQAGRNVGTSAGAAAIDLRANTVAARAGLSSDPGSIFLNEDAAGGNLNVGTADNLIDNAGTVSGVVAGLSGSGSVDIRTEAGSLSLDQVVTAQGTGDVVLDALGGASDLTLNATVTARGRLYANDTVHLRAGRDVLQPSASVVRRGRRSAAGGGSLDRHGHRRGGHRPEGQYRRGPLGPGGDPGDIFLNQDAGGGTLTIGTAANLIDGGTVAGVVANGTSSQISIATEANDLRVSQNIMANGTGDVVLNINGSITIDNGIVVASSTGQVTNAPPVLSAGNDPAGQVVGSSDTVQDIAGTLGGDSVIVLGTNDEWGENFTITIYWADPVAGGLPVDPANPGTRVSTVVPGVGAGDVVNLYVGPNGSIVSLTVTPGAAPGQIELHLHREYSLAYLATVTTPQIPAIIRVRNDSQIRLYDTAGTGSEHLNEVTLTVWTNANPGMSSRGRDAGQLQRSTVVCPARGTPDARRASDGAAGGDRIGGDSVPGRGRRGGGPAAVSGQGAARRHRGEEAGPSGRRAVGPVGVVRAVQGGGHARRALSHLPLGARAAAEADRVLQVEGHYRRSAA